MTHYSGNSTEYLSALYSGLSCHPSSFLSISLSSHLSVHLVNQVSSPIHSHSLGCLQTKGAGCGEQQVDSYTKLLFNQNSLKSISVMFDLQVVVQGYED